MRCQSFLIAVVILVAEGCVSGQSMHAPEYNSVQQGVYSATQAARGEAVWNNHCAECHYPEEYSNGYLYAWSGENVFDLYAYLRITMPYLAPGTLDDEQYVDVTAFLLSQNLLPAGDAELAVDRESLQGILIEGPF
ncbi:MAG: c-type cytochrome [Gammaproteobacteria bacterium]|nr:c-type cytochrome [Gammaproteobacteria bacterium]